MKAMADIVIDRHFKGRLDTVMISAIAEIESNKQPFAYRYEPKLGEASTGIMQTLQSTAEWLARDMGYRAYEIEGAPTILYRPFVSVYFGAAFLKWLSTYDGKKRNEEFMVRAYNGGPKKATHKSTLQYWTRYQLVKQEFPVKSNLQPSASSALASNPSNTGREWTYWDDKVSREDMMEMWKRPEVRREWTKDGEIEGKVRFSRDSEKRPYLTTTELKAVAEIIVSRHFASNRIRPALLASLAEICSMRLLYGSDPPNGIMQIGFPTALWLYKDSDYTDYKIRSLEDLSNPFVSMYFGTAYVSWLSTYEGRERSDKFIIQAYMGGPQGVNVQETGPFWLKYLDTLPKYETKKMASQGGCAIL
jgi:soluble lytic murein transglycosylase-like protein